MQFCTCPDCRTLTDINPHTGQVTPGLRVSHTVYTIHQGKLGLPSEPRPLADAVANNIFLRTLSTKDEPPPSPPHQPEDNQTVCGTIQVSEDDQQEVSAPLKAVKDRRSELCYLRRGIFLRVEGFPFAPSHLLVFKVVPHTTVSYHYPSIDASSPNYGTHALLETSPANRSFLDLQDWLRMTHWTVSSIETLFGIYETRLYQEDFRGMGAIRETPTK
ncbi:hypothetical protein K439DRAFT_711712 [Ramaria rubella]|nr:hypothetical protein K439DRAFT_711712 [Ramaria rubella]